MIRTTVLICALSTLAPPLGAAQLYRWVDEKGNVEWRDTPPPSTAGKVEQRRIDVSTIPASDLPYSVQQAVKNFPVTLWATPTPDCGDLCTRARAHLERRGIPYIDKNPQSDLEGFKKASGGSLEIPLLFVGSNRLKGYLESDWDAAFDTAGYPKTALTPAKPLRKAAATPKEATAALPAVKLYTSADCGTICSQAKALLDGRGIKYEEVAVEGSTAIEELRKVSGDAVVPVLVVGQVVVKGLEAGRYHHELDQAGFQRAQTATKP